MKVGDRVRVTESIKVYHFPRKMHQAIDIQGMEGEIKKLATEHQGKVISANLPLHVKIEAETSFLAHLQATEIEVISE